jgi:hypothetical protein
MDSSGIHIRDSITVDQDLLNELQRSKTPDVYVIARDIKIGAEGEVRLTGRNLIFIADQIRVRQDGILKVLAKPLPPRIRVPGAPPTPGTGAPGKPVNPGPSVTFYCRHISSVSVSSIGSTGGTGDDGRRGDNAIEACIREPRGTNSGPLLSCEIPQPSPRGKRGGSGGPGGAGGVITVNYVTRSGSGTLLGVGGNGGTGGAGGPGGAITRKITQTSGDHTTTSTQATNRVGEQGPQGSTGPRGTDIAARFVPLGEDALYAAIRGLLGGQIAARWALYRLRQGEFLFRSQNPTNLGAACSEFDAVLKLAQSQVDPPTGPLQMKGSEMLAEARRLREFVAAGQNVFGIPRRLQLVPHVENVLGDLAPYESLPLLLELKTLSTVLQASGAGPLRGYIQTQRDALQRAIDPGGSLAIDLKLAANAASESERAKNDSIELARRLREELDELRDEAQLEQMNGTDGDMILPGVRATKLFAIVAATILTAALPPAAVGTVGIVVSTVVPQLPDLLLGKGSPAEQSLQELAKSGAAFAGQLAQRLQNLEETSESFRRYAELYENQLNRTGDVQAAYAALEAQVKKDFAGDLSAAKQFAIDFKKLKSDLQSVQVGPDKPKQTAFLAKARELAAVAHQAQAAIVAAQQASLAREAADARSREASQHVADLDRLLAEVDKQTMSLREATARALARAQRTLSLLSQFQFRLVRALDLNTLASERGTARFQLRPHALRVPYDAGFVSPDILQDYAESAPGDTAAADRLLRALDGAFDNGDLSLNVRAQLLAFRNEHGPRLGDISHSIVWHGGSPELTEFKSKGRLRFRIPLEAIPFAYEAKVQNVQVILQGMPENPADPSTLNLEVVRRGSAEQRWHPKRKLTPSTVTEHLLPGPEFSGRDNLTLRRAGAEGEAARQFSGASDVDEASGLKIALQCFGRGVGGDWELSLSDISRATDLSRVAQLSRIEFIVSYGAWVDAAAVVVQSLALDSPLTAGETAQGTVTLLFAPTVQPARVQLRSSEPQLVRVPDSVEVPVGARSASFPVIVDGRTKSMAPRLQAQAANVRSVGGVVAGRRQTVEAQVVS